jgi:hypothetical protein
MFPSFGTGDASIDKFMDHGPPIALRDFLQLLKLVGRRLAVSGDSGVDGGFS